MDKITISNQEVAEVKHVVDEPAHLEPKLQPPVPWWAKVAFSPLVLVIPVLAFIAIILRVATRNQPPRIKYAWTAFFSTLLIISGFITSAATVLMVSFVPLPAIVSAALDDLDQRTVFPSIPSAASMSGAEVSSNLKPLVAVITPARRMWFSQQESPAWSLGAGILLRANADGYLFATAHHVVDGEDWRNGSNPRALVAMASGVWAGADVVGRHKSLDLALLWVPRQSGFGDFVQPIAAATEGQSIFVIGHPAGLRFTLSNGLVSRMQQSILQISAPVSPGNSGGPVFDDKGNLVGIVVSKMDRSADPNAENLNFAITANALLEDAAWNFSGTGRQRLKEYEDVRAQNRTSTKGSPGTSASSHRN